MLKFAIAGKLYTCQFMVWIHELQLVFTQFSHEFVNQAIHTGVLFISFTFEESIDEFHSGLHENDCLYVIVQLLIVIGELVRNELNHLAIDHEYECQFIVWEILQLSAKHDPHTFVYPELQVKLQFG